MSRDRWLTWSDRWFTTLQRFYPADFRDDHGEALVEAYRDRARDALQRGGLLRLMSVWLLAFKDALRNGPGERVRPAASWRRGGNWGRDVEFATRRLRRAPAFAAATIATLALGLGMFAVVYTTVQRVLIDPLPYRSPGDLYYVWRDYNSLVNIKRGALAGSDVVALRQSTDVIEDAAAMVRMLGGIFSIRPGGDPIEIVVTVTSPQLFEMLGVTPALGRSFLSEEAGRGRPNVIMLSHELWTRFGADPAVVGSQVRLQGNPYTVVGVLPPGFDFARHDANGLPQRADAYTTIAEDLAEANPQNVSYSTLVRARPGTSPEVVAAAVAAAGERVDRRDFNDRGLALYSVGLKDDLISRVRPVLLVLAAAGAVLLVMLSVNLASVLLARAAQREHEFAVSRALGASSSAVMRATLFEGGLLGGIGGAAGVLAAVWATRILVALAPADLPRRETIAIDWRIAAVIIGSGIVLGLVAAVVPAMWAARTKLSSLLSASAVRGGGGHGRMRRGLIATQVALSLVLLSAGGLVARSVDRLLRADPGFRPESALTMRIRTPPEFFPTMDDKNRFQDGVEQALAAIPGVTGVSATSALPLTASAGLAAIGIPGAPGNSGDPQKDSLVVDFMAARAGYVPVMGMRLVAGRAFDPVRRPGVREAIVDQGVIRHFFPTGNPLGATIAIGGPPEQLTIVGVVEQARLYDVHQDGRPQLYVRAEDWGFRPLSYVVRSQRPPESIIPEVRAAVRQVDARIPVGELRTLEQIVDGTLRQQQTGALLIVAFATGALLLAAMGLFGVVSGSVTRRRRELAVRLALGADYRRLLRLVIGEGAVLVAIGCLVALPGIYLVGRLIRGLLVGVSPLDPVALAAVAAALGVVTLLACYLPARRVLRIDPALLLRQE